MILGKIIGKTTTNKFSFKAEKPIKKLDYLQIAHPDYGFVLCQVLELERTNETIAKCQIIGYFDDDLLKSIRIPFSPGTEVLLAEDELIKQIMSCEGGAYIGKLEGKDISVHLNLKKLLTKHFTVLAKSGAGKSYTVGVILEEILEQKIPLIIFDPHGEYRGLSENNNNEKEKARMIKFGIKPKHYSIREYGDITINSHAQQLKLSNKISQTEIGHLIPGKLNAVQTGLLYSAMQSKDKIDLASLILNLEAEDSSMKWTLINILEGIKNMNLFSDNPTSLNRLLKSGTASIINLKGIPPEYQEIIVYKLLSDLFEARKQNKIPPFFCVMEEAHNFMPERSFGETKASKILRTIASEGRKFGMGLCIISQRPARIDKSVLSQCTTQIVLKVTNPNDLKALGNSIEGLTIETENEIKNLPIGTALITGISEMPLMVNIRPRKTKHGGEAVNIIQSKEKNLDEQMEEFEEQELIPVIKPKTTAKDIKLMEDDNIIIESFLHPCKLITCKTDHEFNILLDLTSQKIVTNIETNTQKRLPELESLTKKELKILQTGFTLKNFTKEQLITNLKFNLASELTNLTSKNYFIKKDKNYTLSRNYLFNRLENVACNYKINFEKIKGEKLTKKTDFNKFKKIIQKFAKIINTQNTFLLTHNIRKKS